MKPVPRHRTDFEFIQSIMDPLTFEKNVVVKYNFFPLTLNLDMPCSLVTASTILTTELNCQKTDLFFRIESTEITYFGRALQIGGYAASCGLFSQAMIFLSGFRFSVNPNALDTFSHQKGCWTFGINTKTNK